MISSVIFVISCWRQPLPVVWLAVWLISCLPTGGQIPVLPPVCYRVSELNYSNLTGAINVESSSLTDSGLMTGIIYYANKPYSMLFYSPARGFIDLGNWNNMGTRGMDINESGQIAVQIGDQQKAMRYTPGVGFEDIGSLGGASSEAEHTSLAIAENGTIAGMSTTPEIEIHASFWSQAGGMQDLGTLGGWFGRANGLNNLGWVSGTSLTEDDQPHVFLSRPGQPMLDLGAGIGGDINNRGVIIGSGRNGIPELIYPDGRRVKITPNFGIASYSVGCLNGHNLFQGTYWDFRLGIGFTAIGGSERHGIVDLNKLIPTNSGWVLTEATGMNNKCQVVGRGWNGNAGRNTMFRLDPVIPPITIRHARTNVLLSWPDTFFPLQLEEAPSAEGTTWQAVSGVTTNSATLPLTHAKRFYRLAIPPPPLPLP